MSHPQTELPKHAREVAQSYGADHYESGGAAYLAGVCVYKNPNQDRSTDGLRANWLWELGWRDAKAKQEEEVQ